MLLILVLPRNLKMMMFVRVSNFKAKILVISLQLLVICSKITIPGMSFILVMSRIVGIKQTVLFHLIIPKISQNPL